MPRETPQPALATTTFAGRDPAVVFLHGLGDTRRYWSAVSAMLPVSFIHGSKDTTAPIDRARALAATRPGWLFFALPGVDHHPWLREPRRCAELVAE